MQRWMKTTFVKNSCVYSCLVKHSVITLYLQDHGHRFMTHQHLDAGSCTISTATALACHHRYQTSQSILVSQTFLPSFQLHADNLAYRLPFSFSVDTSCNGELSTTRKGMDAETATACPQTAHTCVTFRTSAYCLVRGRCRWVCCSQHL